MSTSARVFSCDLVGWTLGNQSPINWKFSRYLYFPFLPLPEKIIQFDFPKDHWTLKSAYFEDPTPAFQFHTLPLEGPRSLGLRIFFKWVGETPQNLVFVDSVRLVFTGFFFFDEEKGNSELGCPRHQGCLRYGQSQFQSQRAGVQKTPPKFNSSNLKRDGFPNSVHLQTSRLCKIFRWSMLDFRVSVQLVRTEI